MGKLNGEWCGAWTRVMAGNYYNCSLDDITLQHAQLPSLPHIKRSNFIHFRGTCWIVNCQGFHITSLQRRNLNEEGKSSKVSFTFNTCSLGWGNAWKNLICILICVWGGGGQIQDVCKENNVIRWANTDSVCGDVMIYLGRDMNI